jgi:hypothetical protein
MSRDPRALEAARRLGTRGGQSWVRTGIWPRNPFRTEALDDLARVWFAAVTAVTAPVVTGRK